MRRILRTGRRLSVLAAVVVGLPAVATAQLSFAGYAAAPVRTYVMRVDSAGPMEGPRAVLKVPGVFAGSADTLTVTLTYAGTGSWANELSVYRGRARLQRITGDTVPLRLGAVDTAAVGDFDGDGRADVRFRVGYEGNGLAAYGMRVFYLFQRGDGRFTRVSFYTFHEPVERDFGRDGSVEIVATDLRPVGAHSYWAHDLFRFDGRTLANVGRRYGFPAFVQLLYRENHRRAGIHGEPRAAPRELAVGR